MCSFPEGFPRVELTNGWSITYTHHGVNLFTEVMPNENSSETKALNHMIQGPGTDEFPH